MSPWKLSALAAIAIRLAMTRDPEHGAYAADPDPLATNYAVSGVTALDTIGRGSSCGLPVAAWVLLFKCTPSVTNGLTKDRTSIVEVERGPARFTPDDVRKCLASMVGVPADSLQTSYGLILITATAEPHAEAAPSGDGYAIALSRGTKRTTVALCTRENTRPWRTVADTSLRPDEVLVASLSLTGDRYLIAIRVEAFHAADPRLGEQFVAMERDFTTALRRETTTSTLRLTALARDADLGAYWGTGEHAP